jgi:hypothetical protein
MAWTFLPELFPDSVRSLAGSIAGAFNWVLDTLLFFAWEAMSDGMGQAGGFGVFAGIMALSALFGIFLLPKPNPEDIGDVRVGNEEETERPTEERPAVTPTEPPDSICASEPETDP